MLDQKIYSLLKVAECGSFVAASKELFITQPAISQQIKSLEKELKTRIFERCNGKIVITETGERVIDCARKLAGLEKSLMEELRNSRVMLEHLTIGVTHTIESNPIAEALAKYCSQNDKISIKIITEPISKLYNMLRSYELDLAIIEGRFPDDSIKHLLLDTDFLVVAVSPDHPFANRNMVTLSELKKERLILRLPNSGTRNLFLANIESNGMSISDFNVILEIDNVATIKDLIRRSFGVSILPKSVCLNEIKKKKIVVLPVENLSMMRETNIAYRSDFTQLDFLQEIVRSYHETLRTYR